MKILMAHNRYQQPGGEDVSFESEVELLRAHGHTVTTYIRANAEIDDDSLPRRIQLAGATIWSPRSLRELRQLLERERPDVAHFQNTFPLISPSAYQACREAGVPIVQTLRNYRGICPSSSLFRDEHICQECLGRRVAWPALRHGCYRGSRQATLAVVAMLAGESLHRALDRRAFADVYIAISAFLGDKYAEFGLPRERLVVKPNFVTPDPGPSREREDFVLFVGRLAPEKGVATLLAAWQALGDGPPLWIVGDGPLRSAVRRAADERRGVRWLGQLPRAEVYELMKRARGVVVPSEWYEPFGRAVVEAFATGVGVVGANLGAITELIDHGRTGLLFKAGSAGDLASAIRWTVENPDTWAAMGTAARHEFEARYSAQRNYEMLLNIYAGAIATAGAVERAAVAAQ